MDIKDQVCSLELAKKLCGASIKQESFWEWVKYRDKPVALLARSRISTQELRFIEFSYSAFTVAELGEILVSACKSDWYSEPCAGIWYCRLHTHNVKDSCTRRIEADTEADARAKMLLWLKSPQAKEEHLHTSGGN